MRTLDQFTDAELLAMIEARLKEETDPDEVRFFNAIEHRREINPAAVSPFTGRA